MHGVSIGVQPYLSEEGKLVDILKSCCKMGYGKKNRIKF